GDRNHDVRIDIVAAECALWPEVADATKRLIAIVAAQTNQQISRLECHAVGEEIAKGDFAVSDRIWKDDGRQNVSDAIVPAQFFLVDESGDHRRIERLRKRGDIELRVGIDRSGAAEASDTVALCDDDAFSVDDHDRQTRHIPVLSSFLDKRIELGRKGMYCAKNCSTC